MRRKFFNPTALVAIGIALATLLTLAVAADGRDSILWRARVAAQRLEAVDVLGHDYDVPAPLVSTIGARGDDDTEHPGGEGRIVALVTAVDRVTPALADTAVSAVPAPRLHSRATSHTSDRAPPAR